MRNNAVQLVNTEVDRVGGPNRKQQSANAPDVGSKRDQCKSVIKEEWYTVVYYKSVINCENSTVRPSIHLSATVETVYCR